MPRLLLCSALAAALLLCSCGPSYLKYNDTARLRIGTPRQQVIRSLPVSPSDEIPFSGSDYHVDAYPLHIATVTRSGGGSVGRNGVFMPRPDVSQSFTEKFFLFYQADTLRYWGMAMDFARSEDSVIARLEPTIHMRLQRYDNDQK